MAVTTLTKPTIEHTHRGPVVARGFVCPTGKQNHGLRIIPGLWNVRECRTCGENFSNQSDIVDPSILPSPEVVQEFSALEGVPVSVAA